VAAADLYRQSRTLATSAQDKKKAYFAEIKCYVDSGDLASAQNFATAFKTDYELSPVEQLKLDAMLAFLKG